MRRALIPHGDGVIVSEPKTARGRRSIALDPGTIEALKAQAQRQLDDQEEKAEVWSDSGYVFTKETGEPLHPQMVSRAFAQAMRGRQAARDSAPRPATYARHAGAPGGHPPEGGL